MNRPNKRSERGRVDAWLKPTSIFLLLIPVFGWAATTLINHSDRLARVEEKEKSLKENIKEIKTDVKDIKKYLLGE